MPDHYVVRVVVCDEYTDCTDASSSQYYGPYRSRRTAERVATSLRRLWRDDRETDLGVAVERVERSGVREMVRRLKAARAGG